MFALGQTAAAQSTDANFPTNLTTNEIVGTIRARDVGDSRLTSYYYTFDGGQGDMFINVVTRNFAGDIDVFAAERDRAAFYLVYGFHAAAIPAPNAGASGQSAS